MAEYVGTENQVSLQKRLQEKHSWFKETPGAFNGGRAGCQENKER